MKEYTTKLSLIEEPTELTRVAPSKGNQSEVSCVVLKEAPNYLLYLFPSFG
jgi:hypothetical protein